MGKSPSIIKESLDRLNERMSIGESRYAMKQEYREAHPDEPSWTVTDNKIHSYNTRSTYQQQTLQFVNWARQTHNIRHLAQLDARSGELVSAYLQHSIDAGKSPWTLQTQRAALRTFFADRTLGSDVAMPERKRETITRSRRAAARDAHVSQARNHDLMIFLKVTGLRRSEIRDLQTTDVYQRGENWYVHVRNGKGGKAREVPVLRGYEQVMTSLLAARTNHLKVFDRIPDHLDVHNLRREYAQRLYQQVSGRGLPPPQGKLQPTDYDKAAALHVSRSLGHGRSEVVLRHYLR